MDTKLLARIGAGAFVAVALTMTVLQLREEPKVSPRRAFEELHSQPILKLPNSPA